MGTPIDDKKFENLKYIYQNPNIRDAPDPLAPPQKPFDINANKPKKDLKKDKKKDKNGKDIDDDDDDEKKPLPRPMGL
jgi:hypothetical protein